MNRPVPLKRTIRADLMAGLQDLATQEHRTPPQQGAWLLEKALEAIQEQARRAGTSPDSAMLFPGQRLWESPYPEPTQNT